MKTIKLEDKPYIYTTDKYKTIDIKLIFPIKLENKYLFVPRLLKQIMNYSSFDYPTEISFNKAIKEHMIINYNAFYFCDNNMLYFEFDLQMPNPKYLKEINFDAALNLYFNNIYKPNANNNSFNKEVFEREKKYIIENIKLTKTDISNYAYYNYLKYIGKGTNINYNVYSRLKLINKVTSEKLYELYKKYIYNGKPIVIVYGDVNKDEITKKLKKYIKFDNKSYELKITFPKKVKSRKTINITEKSNYSDSDLLIGYSVKDYKEKDEKYLMLIKVILSFNPNNVLINKLRYKENLVYTCNCFYSSFYKFLTFESLISNNNKEKTIKSIKSVLKSLKSRKNLEIYIKKLIESFDNYVVRSKDDKYKVINSKIDQMLKLNILDEDIYKFYQQVDINYLIKLIDRLELNTIYFLEGENND